MNSLLGVRRSDARTVWTAFATLLVIVAAHAVLETARDSLFLGDLSPQRLPWAYLGIALLAFVVARVSGPLAAVQAPGRMLALLLLAGSAGTAVLWRSMAAPTPTALLVLYIWTGVLASVVVTQFWVQLGGRMDVARARRAYAVVAAGGMLGATLGSLLAGLVLTRHAPRHLLAVAASLFAGAAILPALSGRRATPDAEPAPPPDPAETPPTLREIWHDAYLKRLVPLAALAPIVAMGIDFIFKSVVAHSYGRHELGPFFARYNASVNGLALLFQLLLAPWLLRRLGVVRSLCVLPGALGAGAVAVGVAGPAILPAALFLRGTDGLLRHSLHRAATEILFVPLSASTRAALRGLTEAVGQRGGQVLGSLLILGGIALGAGPRALAVAVAVLCALWLVGFVRLQRHYLDRFRTELRHVGTGDASVPELDMQSLEVLVATLSSPNDAEVLAAMEMLARFGRTHLVPPLILYHPSSAVVLRGLASFDGVWRDDVQGIRRRLVEHADPAVRAAALRGLAAGGADLALVRTVLQRDGSPMVRATALTLWMGAGAVPEADVDAAVRDLLAAPDPDARLAVAATLGELPPRLLVPVARALLRDATPGIRQRVAQTLAANPDVARLDILIELVAMPESRAAARAGLLALGEPALETLAALLADPATPASLRRHLPRSISPFGSERAAAVLLAQLDRETDGRVLYKILRGLGRMRSNDPSLALTRPVLIAYAERTLERTIVLLAYGVAWEQLRGTTSHDDLLGPLLAEKERRALERVFRVLQILETHEDFATMYAALRADAPATRAGARELIDHVLAGGFRDALLALTDAAPAAERLAAAARTLPVPLADTALALAATPPVPGDPRVHVLVDALCTDRSTLVSALAREALGDAHKEAPRVAS